MKKILSIIFVLIICIQSAVAMNSTDYPKPDTTKPQENSMAADIDGTQAALILDSSTEYSYIENNCIQACFYAYNADNSSYMEIYVLLPESVQAGDVITPSYCLEHSCNSCSISFGEVSKSTQTFYCAMGTNGVGYPSGVDYTITVSSVTGGGNSITVTGYFTAVLARYEGINPTQELMTIKDAQFNCTVTVRSADTPAQTPDTTIIPDINTPAPGNTEVPASLTPASTPFAVRV